MTKNVGIIQTKKSIADAFRRCCENRKSYYGNSDNWDYDGYAEESALVTYFMTAYKDCSINPQNVTLLQNVNVKFRYACSKASVIEGVIIDNNTMSLYFVEAKRIKDEPKVCDDATDELFKIREEIYVGKGEFCGINLFD